MAKKDGFEALAAQFKKKWGHSVEIAADLPIKPIPRISTGNFGLDVATFGGVPQGRIVRFWGREKSAKTGSALNTVAQFQQHCSQCFMKQCSCKDWMPAAALWIDLECKIAEAGMKSWALQHGIDMDRFLVARADCGEAAVDMAEAVLRSTESGIGLVVIDSIANMTPSQEIEKAAEDGQTIGRMAQLVNKAFRKWTVAISQAGVATDTRPTVILINQIREKTGVSFGCFEYNAMVSLADGTRKRIGEIVKERAEVEVLSVVDGEVIPRRVIGWHQNGSTDKWLKVTVSRPGRQGKFKCTPNHEIATPTGYALAGDLAPGDNILVLADKRLNERGQILCLGMALGDGNIRVGSKFSAILRVEHGPKQHGYCKWKSDLLVPIISNSNERDRGWGKTWKFSTVALPELKYVHDSLYKSGNKVFGDFQESLTPLEIAIWYMDDGMISRRKKWGRDRCMICIAGYSAACKEKIKKYFIDRGMECELHGNNLCFTANGSVWFQEAICKYVPPCMQYKLSEGFQNKYHDFSLDVEDNGKFLIESEVIRIEEVSIESVGGHHKYSTKYDITVEDGQCYFVSDTLVHNSNETMPGGLGQAFGTSMDVKFTRAGYFYKYLKKDGSESIVKTPKQGDHTPDYMESKYRVTNSSVCPKGRFGTFNYWLKRKEGHRPGDPDNAGQMLTYMKRYGFIPDGKGENKMYNVIIPVDYRPEGMNDEEAVLISSSKKTELEPLFYEDADAQDKVRDALLSVLLQEY